MPDAVYGYQIRPPYPGEDDFFRRNPHVGGMAAEDGKITLNPHSRLSAAERQAVARNEAIRLHQRDLGMRYTFPLTEQQRRSFAGSAYATDEDAARQTIVARALTGDPSAGELPEDQRAAAAMTQAFIDMQERSRPTDRGEFPEGAFRQWYGAWAAHTGLDRNPDSPEHKYNYRAAYDAGVAPSLADDGAFHWPSQFKSPDHPNRFVPLPGGGVLDSLLDRRVK